MARKKTKAGVHVGANGQKYSDLLQTPWVVKCPSCSKFCHASQITCPNCEKTLPAKRGKKAQKVQKATQAALNGHGPSLATVSAAKEFIASCGSLEAAEETLALVKAARD